MSISGQPLSDVDDEADAEIPTHAELVRGGRLIELSETTATIDRTFFVELLWPTLRKLRFDEEYYRSANKDIREAEARGVIKDLYWHYVHFGFFEDRLPCLVEVDAAFYTRTYPDVAAAIVENRVASCQAHFESRGFAEGRLPRRGWRFADLMQA